MIVLSLPLLQGKAYWTGNILQDLVIIQIIGAMAITGISVLVLRTQTTGLLSASEEASPMKSTHGNAGESWWQKWLPFGVMGLIMTGYFRMDVVVLGVWGNGGSLDQGWYAASYRLLDAGMMLPLLLGQMWIGRFAFLDRNHQDIHRLLNQSVSLLIGLGMAGLFVALPRLEQWMAWWYPASVSPVQFDPSNAQRLPVHLILGWHAAAFFPMALNVLLGSLLTAHRAFDKLIPLHAVALLLNLFLLSLWVPELGAIGAARACTLTHTLVMIAQWVLVVRLYHWNPFPQLWKPITAVSVAGTMAIYFMALMDHPLQIWQEGLVTGIVLALVWVWTSPKSSRLA
jgi:O-antigen/teichoic acid export membrane protein